VTGDGPGYNDMEAADKKRATIEQRRRYDGMFHLSLWSFLFDWPPASDPSEMLAALDFSSPDLRIAGLHVTSVVRTKFFQILPLER